MLLNLDLDIPDIRLDCNFCLNSSVYLKFGSLGIERAIARIHCITIDHKFISPQPITNPRLYV